MIKLYINDPHRFSIYKDHHLGKNFSNGNISINADYSDKESMILSFTGTYPSFNERPWSDFVLYVRENHNGFVFEDHDSRYGFMTVDGTTILVRFIDYRHDWNSLDLIYHACGVVDFLNEK